MIEHDISVGGKKDDNNKSSIFDSYSSDNNDNIGVDNGNVHQMNNGRSSVLSSITVKQNGQINDILGDDGHNIWCPFQILDLKT